MTMQIIVCCYRKGSMLSLEQQMSLLMDQDWINNEWAKLKNVMLNC